STLLPYTTLFRSLDESAVFLPRCDLDFEEDDFAAEFDGCGLFGRVEVPHGREHLDLVLHLRDLEAFADADLGLAARGLPLLRAAGPIVRARRVLIRGGPRLRGG